MNDRRLNRTPFTYRSLEDVWGVYGTDGRAVASVLKEEHAVFICKACNRYDLFIKMRNLARAEIEDTTLPHFSLGRKALAELFEQLKD